MTKAQETLFLRELAFSGNIAFACRAAGVSRGMALEERELDARFERLWRQAQNKARKKLAERAP